MLHMMCTTYGVRWLHRKSLLVWHWCRLISTPTSWRGMLAMWIALGCPRMLPRYNYETAMCCPPFRQSLTIWQLEWCCSGQDCDVFVIIFMEVLALTGRMMYFKESDTQTLRDKCLADILRERIRNFHMTLPWLHPSPTFCVYRNWMCCLVAHYSYHLL